jgi:hypothetical protein
MVEHGMCSTTKFNLMKALLTTNWNFSRIFRVALGTISIISAIVRHDMFMGWAGGMILLMGLTNTGCFAGSCATPAVSKKEMQKEPETTTFEEVK